MKSFDVFNHANKHHHDERIKVVYKKNSISLLQMPTLSVPGPIFTELVLNSYLCRELYSKDGPECNYFRYRKTTTSVTFTIQNN